MLAFSAFCGLCTLAGFLLPKLGTLAPAALPLFIAAYLSGGWFASIQLAGELRRGVFDINLLMIVVAIGAATVGAWAEGGTLLFLFSLSNALEQFANHRTEQTINSLLKSAPETVCRRENGEWVEVPADSLGVGDELLVKPGDLFPTDGDVCEGTTSADESALTGEALPVSKRPGDPVSGGTVNLEGRAVIRVRRLPGESAVQRIIDLIESAREQKAPAQRFTDTFTRYYTVVVLAGSVAFLGWLLLAQREPFTQALYHMMTLLVVASPCALVLSIPSAILVAIAAGRVREFSSVAASPWKTRRGQSFRLRPDRRLDDGSTGSGANRDVGGLTAPEEAPHRRRGRAELDPLPLLGPIFGGSGAPRT